uniref:Uncharacterized protein n=1 Tax=Mesocestoides corti TaxID=53468 RepID=A0A5K3FJD0_MESCO
MNHRDADGGMSHLTPGLPSQSSLLKRLELANQNAVDLEVVARSGSGCSLAFCAANFFSCLLL